MSLESYVENDGHSASLYWSKAPFWGLRPDLYCSQEFPSLLMYGALSDETTGLSFTIAAGPRQCSHFRVSQIWHFPLCGYPASTRDGTQSQSLPNITRVALYDLYCWDLFTESLHSNGRGADRIEISHVIPCQRIHWCAACCAETSNKHSYFYCCVRFNMFTESLSRNALAIHVTIQRNYATIFTHILYNEKTKVAPM
jgi:hypothetical protein